MPTDNSLLQCFQYCCGICPSRTAPSSIGVLIVSQASRLPLCGLMSILDIFCFLTSNAKAHHLTQAQWLCWHTCMTVFSHHLVFCLLHTTTWSTTKVSWLVYLNIKQKKEACLFAPEKCCWLTRTAVHTTLLFFLWTGVNKKLQYPIWTTSFKLAFPLLL